ncbi:MAG: hypothetical protein ACR2OB_02220 [Solirubrobacteraceae bacterium]
MHHTKLLPTFPAPSFGSLRELSVRLVLGEHGAGSSTGVRWLEFVALIVAIAAVLVVLKRLIAADPASHSSRTVVVIRTTGALVLVGHALAAIVGPAVFNQQYLTVLIPLAAALLATAVIRQTWPWLPGAVVAAVDLVAVAVFVQRYQREYEPDVAPLRAAVAAEHPRTVVTDSPVMAYHSGG